MKNGQFKSLEMTDAQRGIILERAGKIPVLELCEAVGVSYRTLQRFCKELKVSYHFMPPHDPAAIELAMGMYADKHPIGDISKATGIKPTYIYYLGRKQQINRVVVVDSKFKRWIRGNVDRIAEMTAKEISEEVGVTSSTVSSARSKYGISPKRTIRKQGDFIAICAKNGIPERNLRDYIKRGIVTLDEFGVVEKVRPKGVAGEALYPLFDAVIKAGYTTFDDIKDFTEEDLLKIRGVGVGKVAKMIAAINEWKSKQPQP